MSTTNSMFTFTQFGRKINNDNIEHVRTSKQKNTSKKQQQKQKALEKTGHKLALHIPVLYSIHFLIYITR